MRELYVISGVTGMTGNELARKLIEENERENKKNLIIGFDNFFCSSLDTVRDIIDRSEFEFHEWDLNDISEMEELKTKVFKLKSEFDKIIYINCAAVVHTKYFYHVHDTFTTNVLGMKAFLDQAISVGAHVFINCSTSEVYSMESFKEGGVREDDYIRLATAEHSQRTSYATGKLMTEFFMKDAVDEGKILGCSIRFANVYSKNELFPDHIIPHIMRELRDKGEVELLENSKVNRRTFLHNEDSCRAVLVLTRCDEALDGTAYNVATDEEVTIIRLAEMCGELLGIENPRITFNGYRASDPERRLLNTDKIRKRTDWEPKVTLAEGLRMCAENYSK